MDSITILVLSIAYSGTLTPRSAASSTPIGATSVGTRIGAALDHHLDRLVVEVDAVLDRADAGTHRRLDAVGRLGVAHHPLAGRRRLGDEHVELVVAEVPMARVVAWRQHAAARCRP